MGRTPLPLYSSAMRAIFSRASLSALLAWSALASVSQAVATPAEPVAETNRLSIPLPGDVAVAPVSGLPTELAAFSGAWGGDAWSGNVPTLLVVETISADGLARVVYAWGDSMDGKIKAGWRRHEARIDGGQLRLPASPRGPKISYQRLEDGALLGRYEAGGFASHVRLTAIAGSDSATIRANARNVPRLWEELRISETSAVSSTAGRSLTLQAMLYRSPKEGKRPLVIFSHGSTGNGAIKPADFPRVMDDATPRIFLSLGFNVVQPLRKGYGRSDGPLLEESFAQESQECQLSSALEDLDATVRSMLHQSYVDPKRIVLVGQSRGGLLSVVYAGQHPQQVAGVINFAGGWWGERMPAREFNLEQFRKAGRHTQVPMLWLYGTNDSYYSSAFIRRAFEAFKQSGGRGQLIEVPDVPIDGHLLVLSPDLWRAKVAAYLNKLEVSE